MEDFFEDDTEKANLLDNNQLTRKRSHLQPHQTAKYWIVSGIVHVTFWVLVLLLLNHWNHDRNPSSQTAQSLVMDNDEELIGTFMCG